MLYVVSRDSSTQLSGHRTIVSEPDGGSCTTPHERTALELESREAQGYSAIWSRHQVPRADVISFLVSLRAIGGWTSERPILEPIPCLKGASTVRDELIRPELLLGVEVVDCTKAIVHSVLVGSEMHLNCFVAQQRPGRCHATISTDLVDVSDLTRGTQCELVDLH